jgi:hypothetical protein
VLSIISTPLFLLVDIILSVLCDYIWMENLNLRGSYKSVIMDYITNNYPALVPLYKKIYEDKSRQYWIDLYNQVAQYATANGYTYLVDEEPFQKNSTGKPIIINYFYHEEIRQSAKK